MKKLFLFAGLVLSANFLTTSINAQCVNPPGDTSAFGNHVWNVYAFNAGGEQNHGQSWSNAYSGYYIDTNASFNSQAYWNALASPSSAPGYQGCPVNADNHSWSAKRKGFPCGTYHIDVLNNDDEAELFVNGILIWVRNNATNDQVLNVWTGVLNDTSSIIFRVTEGGGSSNGAITVSTITPSGFVSACAGHTLQLSAPASENYVWSTGDITQSIGVDAPGIYSVTTTLNGCTGTSSFAVPPVDTPALFLDGHSTYIGYCDGGLSVVDWNADSSLNYSWNSLNMQESYFGLDYTFLGGNYILTVTDPKGCTAISHFNVPGPAIADTIYGNQVWKVNGYNGGDAQANFFSWNPQGGRYKGFYTDSSLNFNSQSQWDQNLNPATAPGYQGCSMGNDYISWSALRQGFPCGTYRIDVLNNADEGQLFVNGKMVWQRLNASTDSVQNVWSGVLNGNSQIMLRVTEGGGPTYGAINIVPINGSVSFITAKGNQTLCAGQSDTLVSNLQGASYLWSDGENTQQIAAAQTGSYTVQVKDSNNCMLTSDPFSVTILPSTSPVAHITASFHSVCDGNPVTLSSDSVSGNSWSTQQNTQTISIQAAGNYSLSVTNNIGCSAQSQITIASGFTPPSPVATNSSPACQNSPINLVAGGLAPGGQVASLNGSGLIYVQQDIPEVNFTIEMWVKTTDPNAGIFSANNDETGATDRNLYLYGGQLWGHVSNSYFWNSGFTIDDGQWHHIAFVVQSGVGQTIYVDGISSGVGNTYDHSDLTGQTAFRIGYSPNALDPVLNGQIDNVRIWSEARSQNDIRNSMGLETPASTTNLVYEATLNGNLNASIGTNGSAIDAVSYAIPDYYTYTWTGAGTPLPSTSETQGSTDLTNGNYYVTATGNGCPSASAATNVTVTPLVNYYVDADGDGYGSSSATAISSCTNPGAGYVSNNTDCNDGNANVHPGATEICNGIDDNCNGQIDEGVKTTFYADADGDGYGNSGSSVQACSAPAGYVSNNTDCNDANKNIHPGASDICNGVDDNCNGVIDENAITATVTPNGSVTFCAGSSLILSANSGTGISYQWLKNNKNISGATKQTYTTAANGSYQVKESNTFSCNSTSASTSVTKVAKPAAIIIPLGNLNICNTGSVTLQANSGTGFKYQWQKNNVNISGATKQTYTATVKGTYKCMVTNASSCSKTSNGLKVIKTCGKESEGNDNLAQHVLSIYPNPTEGKFMLDLKTDEVSDGQAKIVVMNIVGQIVYMDNGSIVNGELNQEINFPADASSGLYIAKVICENHTYEGKIIYQH